MLPDTPETQRLMRADYLAMQLLVIKLLEAAAKASPNPDHLLTSIKEEVISALPHLQTMENAPQVFQDLVEKRVITLVESARLGVTT